MSVSREATLDEVLALIARMPDASVVEHYWSADDARVVVQATGTSAEALDYAAWTANISVEIDKHDPRLRVVVVSSRQIDTLDHGSLQILGIHLVWHLLKVNELPRDVGLRLLSAWNAADVSWPST